MPRLDLIETSLRHGQQSLLVSRLRERHAVAVAQQLDRCGFAALEVFGGTTFEAQLRFLGEHPFARLKALRDAVSQTPLLATIGGQALVGHRHVADDVVDAFIGAMADTGIDVIRVLDPLNDVRNLQRAVRASTKAKRRVTGVLVYDDGLPGVAERLVSLGSALVDLGCDSLCLHDPLGLISVVVAQELVSALTATCKVPLTVSFSAQTGQADMAYLAAVEAGAGIADVALAPLAGGASYPAAEAVIAALRDSDYDTGLDLRLVSGASLLLESAMVHYGDIADTLAMRLDTSALRGLLPPSAMGHALVELRDRDALDRIVQVEDEVQTVRKELGHPPLVTPLTEIIATQAVYNVCDGERYLTISQEVKDYCLGLYGNPPMTVAAEVRRAVNGRDEPITCRPADLIEAQMPASKRELEREGHAPSIADTVTHVLFPNDFLALATGEVSRELLGDEDLAPTGTDAEVAPEPVPPAASNGVTSAAGSLGDDDEVRELTVEVDGQSYAVRVIGTPGMFAGGVSTVGAGPPVATIREGTVTAPMQGLILSLAVAPGDTVAAGDVVAVLEAMKMQNDITALRSGRVSDVHVAVGAVVSPGDAIVTVE